MVVIDGQSPGSEEGAMSMLHAFKELALNHVPKKDMEVPSPQDM